MTATAATPSQSLVWHRRLQLVGYLTFFGFMGILAGLIASAPGSWAASWQIVAVAVAAYLAADLLSGLVHFLADNFGSPDTPFLGPGFVLPFREHHRDPKGITRHGFFEANGNNALVCLPVLIPTVLWMPITHNRWGLLAGLFVFVLLVAVFFTNQVHKWAHMDVAPAPIRVLQRWGIIISKDHHDLHHSLPYDTYYCITVGVWNPLFERFHIFPRLERFIRRWVPGADPRTRVEREGSKHSLPA